MVSQLEKTDIVELERDELVQWFAARRQPAFRAEQVMRWIYGQKAAAFDQMTNLGKTLRQELDAHFTILPMTVATEKTAPDGTRKFLFELNDGNYIETVLIPERDHYTLCISTQVGCAMGCRFCMTATTGLTRNLTKGEIVGQVMAAQIRVPDDRRLSNLVLMGMGEPLANFDNVMRAIRIITDGHYGMQFSTRRVTLSTVGLVPRLAELAAASKIRLAVSLNAADNATRDMLMPVNRRYPIEALLEACAKYPMAARDKITFEYILIKDVNDSAADARRLAKILAPIKAKINLIPFNPHPESQFDRPDSATIDAFQAVLHEKNFTAIVRWSKGTEIAAACGQLKGEMAN
ncbi:MAG: 23S rRNA (adenine(2503)-C(2))-methyltransferase RlmN [Thermodesulfobacteriota bacterium]